MRVMREILGLVHNIMRTGAVLNNKIALTPRLGLLRMWVVERQASGRGPRSL
jgi:hypothetical protein